MKDVKAIYIWPPRRGAGGAGMYYMAYYDGDEAGGARGWGVTEAEARRDLIERPQTDPVNQPFVREA